jgi:hypothetical protein
MQNGADRRKKERIPFREHILIDGIRPTTSIDISEGGIYLSSIQFFEENTIVDISIPFQDETIDVKGKVQFHQPGIGLGIMFIDLTEDQKAKIQKIISRLS